MPDLCKEIVKFITNLKRSKEHEKSFLDYPLPAIPELQTSTIRTEIEALRESVRVNNVTPIALADAFTKGIDYLADPAIIRKICFCLGEYDNIFNLSAAFPEKFNNEFWTRLNNNINRLNNDKYKQNTLPG